MALDLESRLRTWLASAPQNVRSIPVLEISHSAMSQTYYLWPEPYAGQVATEDDEVVQVKCANFGHELAGTPANLDQVFRFGIDTTPQPGDSVDFEEVLRDELDAIPIDTTERVLLVYREYLSDDLTEPQAVAELQAESIAFTRGVALITATSPRFNVTRTGLLYSPREIEMLRGFL